MKEYPTPQTSLGGFLAVHLFTDAPADLTSRIDAGLLGSICETQATSLAQDLLAAMASGELDQAIVDCLNVRWHRDGFVFFRGDDSIRYVAATMRERLKHASAADFLNTLSQHTFDRMA